MSDALCAQFINEELCGERKRFLAGLSWAAKRVGPCTHSLDLFLTAPKSRDIRIRSFMAEDEMIVAFYSAQQLEQLLCLHV